MLQNPALTEGNKTDFPLRLTPPEAFAAVRDFLRQSAFDDVTICRVLGLTEITEVGRFKWGQASLAATPAPLRWSLDFFLLRGQADEQEGRKFCGDATWKALEALGLVRASRKQPGSVYCPVLIYPAKGFVIASDRLDDPEGGSFSPAQDVVFPAIYAGTLRFLLLLPQPAGGDALDLCGGTGIGALQLSRSARSTVTADLTPRSAFFAEFNARLNDAAIESCCGDLYAPVHGRQFDVISAHPPFVPSMADNMVYRDGGATGEEVTQRIVAGLPTHLRRGGACVILCVARDTQEQTLEQRARDWLGSAQDEFDVLFGLEKILSVEEVMHSLRKNTWQRAEDEARLLERLRALNTRQYVYGALVIRRQAQGAGAPPFRVRLAPEGTAADLDRVLAWRHFCRGAGFSEWLANARPRLAKNLQLTVRHVTREGELTPVEFVFSIEEGLPAALRPDGWIVPALARLNGTRSPREVFDSARLAGELPDGFGLEPWLQLVERMIGMGLLEVQIPRSIHS
jgi:methylase of polypeptide subunit release factors